jgi:hypothetical protein
MTPLDITNFDETLIRPLPGAVGLEPRTALVPLPAYDRYLTACRAALAACRNAGEVKEVRNRAAALKEYARRAKDKTLEADAYEIRARAERRLGEMLIEQKETVGFAKGGQPYQATGSVAEPVAPTLAEAGIDKKLSMTAQRLAKLPGSEFECIVAEDRERIIAFGREHAPLDNLKGGVEWYTPSRWIEPPPAPRWEASTVIRPPANSRSASSKPGNGSTLSAMVWRNRGAATSFSIRLIPAASSISSSIS